MTYLTKSNQVEFGGPIFMTYFTLEYSIISRQIIHSFEIGTLSLLNLLK